MCLILYRIPSVSHILILQQFSPYMGEYWFLGRKNLKDNMFGTFKTGIGRAKRTEINMGRSEQIRTD